jgi:hypothetical protein
LCLKTRRNYTGDDMSYQNLERLMREARATSDLARAATWRALVTARQIEKLVRPRSRKIEIALGNAKGTGSE